MKGTDIKDEKYKRTDQHGRSLYWVPQSDLRHMSSLKKA